MNQITLEIINQAEAIVVENNGKDLYENKFVINGQPNSISDYLVRAYLDFPMDKYTRTRLLSLISYMIDKMAWATDARGIASNRLVAYGFMGRLIDFVWSRDDGNGQVYALNRAAVFIRVMYARKFDYDGAIRFLEFYHRYTSRRGSDSDRPDWPTYITDIHGDYLKIKKNVAKFSALKEVLYSEDWKDKDKIEMYDLARITTPYFGIGIFKMVDNLELEMSLPYYDGYHNWNTASKTFRSYHQHYDLAKLREEVNCVVRYHSVE